MSDAQRKLIAEVFVSLDDYAFSAKAGPYFDLWSAGADRRPLGTYDGRAHAE